MSLLPPLRALQVFEAVGHCGGISQAAKRLGISPAAVSQQMKLLEDALGLPLTVKEGQRIRLNAAGVRFHKSCSSAFETLRVAAAGLQRSQNSNTLYICAVPSLSSKWLAPLIYTWQAEHPDLKISIGAETFEPSGASGVDFRISYGEGIQADQYSLELFRDCVVPACSPDLLRKNMPLRTPADLLAYPLITIDWRPHFVTPPSWPEWFSENEIPADQWVASNCTYGLSSMAIQAAIDGQGVILAQYSMIAHDIMTGRLVVPYKYAISVSSSYYLSWNHDTFHKPQCRTFHRWMIARGREQQEITNQLIADNVSP